MFNENFWETTSFLIFIALVYKPIKNQIVLALQEYSKTVLTKLNESTKLREEAEKYMLFYKDEHARLSAKSKKILESTEENIILVIKNAQIKLSEQIEIKKRMHQEKINTHKKMKIARLKLGAIDQATHIAKLYLKDHCATLSASELKYTLQLMDHHKITN